MASNEDTNCMTDEEYKDWYQLKQESPPCIFYFMQYSVENKKHGYHNNPESRREGNPSIGDATIK